MEYTVYIDWISEEEERFLQHEGLDDILLDMIYETINKYLREHQKGFDIFLKEEAEDNWDERTWLNKWYERMNG